MTPERLTRNGDCPVCGTPIESRDFASLSEARETIRRLNRRIQLAESALAEKLDEAKRSGGSLGRSLSAWAYTATSERLNDIAASLHDMKWDDLPMGLHRYRREDAKYAKADDFTDISLTRTLPDRATPISDNGPSAEANP